MKSDNQAIIDHLFCHFKGDHPVRIVFENKPALLGDGPVINLSIHPIRFCDDIFFNFETNDLSIYQKIKSYEVDYNIFYYYADCIKAQMVKHVQDLSLPENSALLIGQLPEDKSVFDGNKFLNLSFFTDQINEIADTHEAIYLKLHTYQKNKRKLIVELKKKCPKIHVIKENIYMLLAHQSIATVAGLNSSVLHEASYFDKQVIFFFKPQFDFENKDIGVFGDYFSSKFWTDILGVQNNNISIPKLENRLRRIFGDYWGYPELSAFVDTKAVLKNIVLNKFR